METKEKRQMSFFYLVKIYLQYARGWFLVVCFSTLISPLLAYIDVIILRDAVDFLGTKSGLSTIVLKLMGWLILYAVTIILNSLIETFWGENVNAIISNRINRKIYTKILETDFKYFDRTDFYNDYTWTLNNFYSQTFSSVQIIWQFLMCLFTISTIGVLMFAMDYIVILLVVASVIVTSLINNELNKEMFKKKTESLIYQRSLNYIQRVFYVKDYAMGVKSTHIKDLLLQKYDASTVSLSNVIKKHRFKVTLLSVLSGLTIYFIKIVTIIYLVAQVYYQNITLGEFTALFYASINLKGQLDQFGSLVTRLKNLNLYTEGIRDFFSLPSDIENSINETLLINEPISVQFDDVYFKYHKETENVLKNLNLSIEAGQKVAIVGRNGVGKSTIAKLLLRLYDTSAGGISINGKDIKTINVKNLRDTIGVAFQDSILYAFSVHENIDVYNGDIPKEELSNLFVRVGLDRVLNKNNATFDTCLTRELDEKGLELSGGEKQLIAIARVLTQKFGLLIFDEPSSSLDPIMEYNLSKMIIHETGDSTVILISHRLSAVRDADKIFMIEDGTVVESGTHQELINLGGKYCELYNLQAEGYIN